MSGTSMDGIDAVIAKMAGTTFMEVCGHAFVPYSTVLKQHLLALQTPATDELHRSALLAQQLAHLNAQAVTTVLQQTNLTANEITAIGCHGMTFLLATLSESLVDCLDNIPAGKTVRSPNDHQ